MRRPIATLLLVCTASTVLPPTSIAWAEPTAADLESARDLFKKGKELREKGDLAGALDKFKAAHALANTPITGVELGRTHMMRGELVEARDAFLSVARIPIKSKESSNAKSARAEAQTLAAELEPRIPSLVITIKNVDASKVVLTIDGIEIPTIAIGEPRRLDPGKHVVVAHAGAGKETRVEVELAEKEHKSLELSVEPPPEAEPPPTTAEPAPAGPKAPPALPPDTSPWSRRTVGWIGVGVAGAGLAVGAITGLVALSRANTAKEKCIDGACPPEVHDAVDGGKTMGDVSTIAFGVAVVGGAVAIIAFASGHPEPKPKTASVQPTFGLGTIGLEGAF